MLNKLLDYSLLTTVMFTSMGLEVWGLYGLLGLSPFVFIGLVASIFKIVLSRWVGIRPVLLVSAFTFVFAVQSPAISLLNPTQCNLQEQAHKTALDDTKAYQRNMAQYARMGVQKGEDARIAGLSMLKTKEEQALKVWTACTQSARNGTWIALIEVIIIMAVEVILVLTLHGIKQQYNSLTRVSSVPRETAGVPVPSVPKVSHETVPIVPYETVRHPREQKEVPVVSPAKSPISPTETTSPKTGNNETALVPVSRETKPWVVLGIPKSTYYRRQQKPKA